MNENRILFVDLDGTLIKEDLSNLAFINYLKKTSYKINFFFTLIFDQRKALFKRTNI